MASENVLTLTSDNFEQDVEKSDVPVLVDFWAQWCGPCKMIAPIINELADDYAGKAKVGKVDIDDHQALAAKFGITSIPTLLVFKGGEVADQIMGLRPKEDLAAALDKALA